MFQDKYVFAQLVSFLNRSKFNRIVARYKGDKYVKHFTCWNQLLALMFGQLSNRESLRDLIVALDAHHSKCYHLGMGKNVSKSSLARANQNRDYRIFEELGNHRECRENTNLCRHMHKDHIHILISSSPGLSISSLVQKLKGAGSHKLFQEYAHLRKQYCGHHLWSRGYFVATTGTVTDEIIKEYIANQDNALPDDDFRTGS
jgi:REP element-mobilizing transposase RayT